MICVITIALTFRGDHTSSVDGSIVRGESMVLPSRDGFTVDVESREMEMEMVQN